MLLGGEGARVPQGGVVLRPAGSLTAVRGVRPWRLMPVPGREGSVVDDDYADNVALDDIISRLGRPHQHQCIFSEEEEENR
jgi:hypothetical protein